MTSAAIPTLAPIIEASPSIARLIIPRLIPIATAVIAPEALIPIAIVGTAYAAYLAWHYFSGENQQAIQAKAMSKYCSLADRNAANCPSGFALTSYSTNNRGWYTYHIYPNSTNPNDIVRYEIFKGQYGYVQKWYYADGRTGDFDVDPSSITETPIGGKPWQEWTAEDRAKAISNLSESDWNPILKAMPQGGTLQPGQTIPAGTVLTGNPNSANPAEREPRTISEPVSVPVASVYAPATAGSDYGVDAKPFTPLPAIPATGGIGLSIPYGGATVNFSPTTSGQPNITINGNPADGIPAAKAPPSDISLNDIWGEIQQLKGALPLIPGAVGIAIAPALTRSLDAPQVRSAAETATCSVVSGKSPCNGNPLPKINQNTDDILKGLDQLTQAGQGALLTAINNTVNTINTKMGAQLTGGLAGGMTRISSFLGVDRLMNLVTTIVVLHNAAMLSSALKDTLLSMVSSVGQATGLLTDSEGKAVDTNALFDQGIETFLKGLLGTDIYNNAKLAFNRANRFYQASSNIVNEFRNIGNGIQAIAERGAEYTGKIGNALKSFGIVGEKAYNWMSENMNTQTGWLSRLQERVSQTTDIISGVDDIAQNAISIQDSVTQLTNEKAEFDKALKDLTPNNVPDNSVVAHQVSLDKKASQPPETEPSDLDRPNNEAT